MPNITNMAMAQWELVDLKHEIIREMLAVGIAYPNCNSKKHQKTLLGALTGTEKYAKITNTLELIDLINQQIEDMK